MSLFPDKHRDILATGEDVTDIKDRALILRAVNTSIAAKLAADRMEESMGTIATELSDIRSVLHTFLELMMKGQVQVRVPPIEPTFRTGDLSGPGERKT
jgi:hypothetical protein